MIISQIILEIWDFEIKSFDENFSTKIVTNACCDKCCVDGLMSPILDEYQPIDTIKTCTNIINENFILSTTFGYISFFKNTLNGQILAPEKSRHVEKINSIKHFTKNYIQSMDQIFKVIIITYQSCNCRYSIICGHISTISVIIFVLISIISGLLSHLSIVEFSNVA